MSEILKKLGEVLEDRKTTSSDPMFSLYDKGIGKICDKVDEESKELINALKTESNDRMYLKPLICGSQPNCFIDEKSVLR